MKKGQQGTSLGAVEKSPERRRREARRRRREESAWASKSGPVVARQRDDLEDRVPDE